MATNDPISEQPQNHDSNNNTNVDNNDNSSDAPAAAAEQQPKQAPQSEDDDLEEGELKDSDDDDDDDVDDGDPDDNFNHGKPAANTAFDDTSQLAQNQQQAQFPHNQQHHNQPHPHAHHQHPQQQQHMRGMSPNNHSFAYANHHPAMVEQNSKYRCRFYSSIANKCTWGIRCRFIHCDDGPPMPADQLDNYPPGGPLASMPMGPGRIPPNVPMVPIDRVYPPDQPPYAVKHQPFPHHQPPMPPHNYVPYHQPSYGPPPHHHQTPPPLPPHSMQPHHWRQQDQSQHYSNIPSPYPPEPGPQMIAQAPAGESGSPSSGGVPANGNGNGNGGGGGGGGGGGSGSRSSSQQPPNQPPSSQASGPTTTSYPTSPSYQTQSPSAVSERRHRLAYVFAPGNWKDRGYPPPGGKYDRGDHMPGYPPPGPREGMYRSHHGREMYGREPPYPPHMGGPNPYSYPQGYSNYPPSYKGGPMRPHASSHNHKYMGPHQRGLPLDVRRSSSNKRGREEDESSWSDSGSEDSILGQASFGNKSKVSKKHRNHSQQQPASANTIGSAPTPAIQTTPTPTTPTIPSENANNEDQVNEGSGTPPGEPTGEQLTSTEEESKMMRQRYLLEKLREVEEDMAKKKRELEDTS